MQNLFGVFDRCDAVVFDSGIDMNVEESQSDHDFSKRILRHERRFRMT